MKDVLKIHGSMFVLFKKFIQNNYSKDAVLELNKATEMLRTNYEMNQNYHAKEMFSIISIASNYLGVSENELKEKFGEYIVPDLLGLYSSYVNPEWKTFEMLQYTEHVMHKAVRTEATSADPPILNITKVNPQLLMIDYHSRRRMASLAIGIIKGIAKYYNESHKVHVTSMTNPNDERVQIKVEFE